MQSTRLQKLPPYLFAELDRKKSELKAKGADIIDLSIGDPDIPTPAHVVDELARAVRDPKNHRYAPYNGTLEFRNAAATYLKESRGIVADVNNEILTLIGSKEGIAHIIFALINPGDVVLVPSPGYPVYSAATILAGGIPYEMPLTSDNNFLPDLDLIPDDILRKAKMLFINYPNNPTAATANRTFLYDAISFAHKYGLLICHDAAYIDIVHDDYKAPSILEITKAKDVAVEFYSLSKTYNMTGWRIGFAVGNSNALASLAKIKTNMDSSATAFVQQAGAFALTSDRSCIVETCNVYKRRRDILVSGLNKAGWKITPPNATFYVWARAPYNGFALRALEEAHVVITPGEGFGTYGKGYVRFALTKNEARIQEAVERIVKIL